MNRPEYFHYLVYLLHLIEKFEMADYMHSSDVALVQHIRTQVKGEQTNEEISADEQRFVLDSLRYAGL